MSRDFIVIAITSPDTVSCEAQKIEGILYDGLADIVHIRKPGWSADETAGLIESINPELWSRLKLHDNFSLLEKYNLLGVHLNSRNLVVPPQAHSVSRSLHAVEQLHIAKHYDYVTLSPVFNSISKAGYKAAFNLNEISELLTGTKNVVALGGVTPDKIPILKGLGFHGAAMLGHFWKE